MSELEARIKTLTQSATRRAVERVEALPAGLGAHRFFRVFCAGGSSVIARVERDHATGSGPEPPLEATRSFLEEAGLPVPRSYLHWEDVDLLEDLGSVSLFDASQAGFDERLRGLYEEACALIPRLQSLTAPASPPAAFTRHWRDFLPLKRRRAEEVALPSWLGRAPRPAERDCLRRAFDTVEAELADAPGRLAHRDFQSSNLMVRAEAPERRVVMIDLQGAFLAPPEYDLVCLLRDSYVVLPDEWVTAFRDATRRTLPDRPDPGVFDRRFDLLCIARKAKDDAFFVEAERRGDPRYTVYRATNRRYLAAAARRLAETFACFEPWVDWLEEGPELAEARPCAR